MTTSTPASDRTADPNTEHTANLGARWAELRADQPRIRIRAAADHLGVSELDLLLTRDSGVTPLRMEFEPFLTRVEELGEVMALTRNASCVIETDGVYRDPDFGAHATGIVQPGVDLRIFPGRWAHLVAVENEAKGGTRRSFQVFDAHGDAVHKIWLRDGSDVAAWERIVADFAEDAEAPVVEPKPDEAGETRNPDPDAEGLLDAWSKLEHTHDFFRLMPKFAVTRTQALELAEGRYTRRLDTSVVKRLLEAAAEREIEIMVFVGNHGCIQIHSGRVHRIVEMDDWINVMDPGFNLHLVQSAVADAWVVTKPTSYGDIHSVEVYAEDGSQIASFFGLRKEGNEVAAGWEELVGDLS